MSSATRANLEPDPYGLQTVCQRGEEARPPPRKLLPPRAASVQERDSRMAQPNGITTTITGTVEAVNERGIKLQGAWLNLSKWRPLPLSTRGAVVSVDVKDGRFLDRIDVLDGQTAHSGSQRAVASSL